MSKHKPRVLIARYDLDGHDRGILVVMNALKNAGAEVIYIHFSNPNEIAKAAIEEDVDLIGITSSLGQHNFVCSALCEDLKKKAQNIPVIIGGVLPNSDIPRLLEMGVKKVFGPGTAPRDVVTFVDSLVAVKDQPARATET